MGTQSIFPIFCIIFDYINLNIERFKSLASRTRSPKLIRAAGILEELLRRL